jgi:hypothetical protein
MVSLPSSSLLLERAEEALAIHRPGFFCKRPSDQVCPHCNRPLMKIDHYGQMLIGCIDCNRWGHAGDTNTLGLIGLGLLGLGAMRRRCRYS